VSAETVAFVGLGRMGLPMADRLGEAGFAVRGYDAAPDAGARLRHATAAASLPEVLEGATVLLLMLPSSAIVADVLLAQGALDALAPGAVVLDMGSSEPLRTRELAAAAAERGLVFVDAPVSGGVVGAENGSLTIMVGGAEADVARVTPLLEVMGKRVLPVGEVGAGHALKALNNLLSAASMMATSEAVRIGTAFGLDPATMLDAINTSSGRSFSTEYKFPTFVVPETFNSGFLMRLMLKDVQIATALGEQLGVPAEFGAEAERHWAAAAAALDVDADHTEIARWVMGEGPQ
jgi:3-hydroxyisobutyrate dehydrogenase